MGEEQTVAWAMKELGEYAEALVARDLSDEERHGEMQQYLIDVIDAAQEAGDQAARWDAAEIVGYLLTECEERGGTFYSFVAGVLFLRLAFDAVGYDERLRNSRRPYGSPPSKGDGEGTQETKGTERGER